MNVGVFRSNFVKFQKDLKCLCPFLTVHKFHILVFVVGNFVLMRDVRLGAH